VLGKGAALLPSTQPTSGKTRPLPQNPSFRGAKTR
jgi:hypothetical protein